MLKQITIIVLMLFSTIDYLPVFKEKYQPQENVMHLSTLENPSQSNVPEYNKNERLTNFQKVWQLLKRVKKWSNWYYENKRIIIFTQNMPDNDKDYSTSLLNIERENMVIILEQSHKKFMESIDGLSNDQLNFKPSSGKWSISECIEHITLAELRFPKIVSEEIKKPSEPEKRSKIKINDDDIRKRMTNRSWKGKSLEIFKPSNQFKAVEDAISAYTAQRLATIEYVKTTEDDLRNHFWNHPLTGTIDLYQTLLLMSAHLERHTEQIEGIKATFILQKDA